MITFISVITTKNLLNDNNIKIEYKLLQYINIIVLFL